MTNIQDNTVDEPLESSSESPRWKLIETAEDLEAVIPILQQAPYLAVDTEFYRRTTYWAQLCLIQIATPDEVFLIDPQGGHDGSKNKNCAKVDLSPLWPILQNQTIPKIFHAPKEDLTILVNAMNGKAVYPLFDTQLAAMYCGHRDHISYGDLVSKICRTDLDKSSQDIDWRKRPLNQKQQAYAADDVIYLRQLFQPLMAEISKLERTDIVLDAMNELSDPNHYRPAPSNIWQGIKGKMPKTPAGRHAVKLLAEWREKQAIAKNKPRSYILDDKTVIEFGIRLPKDKKSMARLPRIKESFLSDDIVAKLIELRETALSLREEEAPTPQSSVRLSPRQQDLMSLLQVILSNLCNEKKIVPHLVISRSDLALIAKNGTIPEDHIFSNSDTKEDTSENWRYEFFGKKIEQFLKGEISLKYLDKKIQLDDQKMASL